MLTGDGDVYMLGRRLEDDTLDKTPRSVIALRDQVSKLWITARVSLWSVFRALRCAQW